MGIQNFPMRKKTNYMTEDETLTDKVLRLLFGDTFFTFIAEYNLDGYDSWEDTVEDLVEDLWMTYWELHEA